MFDTQNSTVYASDQAPAPVKDHSLAAHFSQWYPVNNVYAQSLHAVVAQAQAEDMADLPITNPCLPDESPEFQEFIVNEIDRELTERGLRRATANEPGGMNVVTRLGKIYAIIVEVPKSADDWRTIGDDDPKPALKQYTLGSIKHVTFQGKHNSVDAFPVKAGDVVTAISQFSWAGVQIVKFGYGDLIGYCWLSDLSEVK